MNIFSRLPVKCILLFFTFLNFLSSCVTLNSGPSQCVPTFTDKKQFQAAISAGLSGVSANIAYSPLKYFSVHANGFSAVPSLLPSKVYTPQAKLYNYQLEGGLGFYYPAKRFIYGANFGCGMGSVSWERWYRPDSGNPTPFFNERFDTKWRLYVNAFFAYKIMKESYSGLSLKYSYFDQYYYLATVYSDYVSERDFYKNEFVRGRGATLTHFMQLKMAKHIYFINEGGVAVSTTAIPAIILKVGLMLKF